MKLARTLTTVTGILLLGSLAAAQNQLPAKQVRGPIKRMQYGVHTPKAAPRTVYANTLSSNYFSTPGTNEEWIDHAVITGNSDHDTITGHEFGYATYNAAQGLDVRIRHYDGYTGFCGSLTGASWDVSITGLPGGGSPGSAAGWIVTLDMSAGDCFYQDNGAFGYSVSYSDDNSGPLLASGGTGNLNRFDWTPSTAPSCGSWWFYGSPWAGFHSEYTGHDGNDTFVGLSCANQTLTIEGPTCKGSTLEMTVHGRIGDYWAIGIGLGAGDCIGGYIGGGCCWDTAVVTTIRMGYLPYSPLPIDVNQNSNASGVSFGIQTAFKGPQGWDTSNVELINVP